MQTCRKKYLLTMKTFVFCCQFIASFPLTMEPRLIYVLIPLFLISKEFIYCRTVTSPLNSIDDETNSSDKGASRIRNRLIGNSTSYQISDSDAFQSDYPVSNNYYSLFEDWIPPYQSLTVINLEFQSPPSSSCAAVLTTSHYVLEVPDNGFHTDISVGQFVLRTADIEKDCFLTVQDCSGSLTTTNNSLPPTTRCTVANSICCECKGCERHSYPEYEDSCAVLYEHAGCSSCNGFRLRVQNEDEVSTMNELVDNKVSSIYVAPGCELIIYKDDCFLGEASLATGSFNLPFEWSDVISSYKCSCSINSTTATLQPSTVTYAATTPEITTVAPTTREVTTLAPTTPEVTTVSSTTSTTPAVTTAISTTPEVASTTVLTTQTTQVTTELTTTPTMTTTEPPVPTSTTTEKLVETTTLKEITTTTEPPTTLPATSTSTTPQPTTEQPTTEQAPTTTEQATTTLKEPTTVRETTTVKYATTEEPEKSTDPYHYLY